MNRYLKRVREFMGMTPEESYVESIHGPHIDNLIFEARDRYEAEQIRRAEAEKELNKTLEEMERNTMEENSYPMGSEHCKLVRRMLQMVIMEYDKLSDKHDKYWYRKDIEFLQQILSNEQYWESDRERLKELRTEYIQTLV